MEISLLIFWDIQDILYIVDKYLESIALFFWEKNGLSQLQLLWRNQGRTPYNTSYRSFTSFGTLNLSYSILPLFSRASIWSYGAGLKFCVLPLFYFLNYGVTCILSYIWSVTEALY